MPEGLADIYENMREDPAWDYIRTTGIVLVPGEGASRPKVMIVGEAPGATENTEQRPFVGASGQVIRSLIADVALLRPEDYFITNVLKYRPALNRTPTPFEIGLAIPYLRREWRALGCPPWIVAVGGTAKNALAPKLPGVTVSAGAGYPVKGGRTIWPMIHPSFVLRHGPPDTPARQVWQERVEQHWGKLGEEFRKWQS
jgi:uracil-DNA glycosylase